MAGKETVDYVFYECGRKIQEATDNKQTEERMELYGRKSNAESSGASETGDSKDR